MKGWIRLYRKILENPIVCKDSDFYSVWGYLILNATHKNYDTIFKGKRITLTPGQLITGRKEISKKFNISESKVQRILKTFEIEQQIEQQTSNINRLISVNNWDEYQSFEQQNEQRVNNKRTTSEQRVNTNNNVNNVNNVNNYKNILMSEIKISELDEKNQIYFKIALSFFELFKQNLLDAGASLVNLNRAKGNWIDDIRLIIENDKYKVDDLRKIFDFLSRDEFWKKNILSTSKLRKQLDKLLLQINYNNHGQNRQNLQRGATPEELARLLESKFKQRR